MKIKGLKKNLILVFIGIILFIVGCSSDDEVESAEQADNESSLVDVLENTFNGPNKELNELLEDPNNAVVIGNDEAKEKPTELDLYLEEMYKPYFTKDMYKEYIGVYGLSYQTVDVQTQIQDITIDQKESENTYDFIVNVKLLKETNKPNSYKITGQSTFSEEGKISGFKISSDNGLSEEIAAENSNGL